MRARRASACVSGPRRGRGTWLFFESAQVVKAGRTTAIGVEAFEWGLPHPCLSAANVRRSHKFPFKLHFAPHTTWLRPPSHCAFLPNSLQTPSRYSCHIYSQHTLPCSITRANPLLHSLLCQLRQACIYKPVFTPFYRLSSSTRSSCVTEPDCQSLPKLAAPLLHHLAYYLPTRH